MNWQLHTDAITHKAASRLHFLRILRKSNLKSHHLLHFYLTVIRPVLEYCSVVWHHGLTKAQSETLEAIQRRAFCIIYPPTIGMPYISQSCQLAFSSWPPWTYKQTIFQIYTFLLYFLLTSYPQRSWCRSTLAQLHAQNATRPSLIIAYWITSNRCECVLLVHDQVTIIFVVSVGLSVCLFVQSFSQPSLIRFRSN